jgi:hypothetical protein
MTKDGARITQVDDVLSRGLSEGQKRQRCCSGLITGKKKKERKKKTKPKRLVKPHGYHCEQMS